MQHLQRRELTRACSDGDEFASVSKMLLGKFMARGYPRTMLKTIRAQLPHVARAKVLEERVKEREERGPFISVHSDRTLDEWVARENN